MPRAYANVIGKSHAVRNEVWISYFLLVGVRSMVRIIGYSLNSWPVEVCAMLLHGITAYILVCALQWQRRYRGRIALDSDQHRPSQNYQQLFSNQDDFSSSRPIADLIDEASDTTQDDVDHTKASHESHSDDDDEILSLHQNHSHSTPLFASHSTPSSTAKSLASFFVSAEFIGFIFMVYYLIVSTVRAFVPESSIAKYLQLSAVVLQRTLILVVLLIIVLMPPSRNRFSSPSLSVRIIAILSIIFNIPNDLPFIFWYEWTPWAHNLCLVYILSFYDLITMSYIISLILWMVFIAIEFHRSREQAMFYAFQVTQAQLAFPDADDSDS